MIHHRIIEIVLVALIITQTCQSSYLTSTDAGSTYTRYTQFMSTLTATLSSNSNIRVVYSSGGAAGGIVSEGMGYGLFIGGATAVALGSSDENFDLVVTQTYQLFLGWQQMCIMSVGSASCQTPYCGGGSYPCLPDWQFSDSLASIEGTGSAPDGDEDAILGMILLLGATESNSAQYSWWSTLAEWTYQSCKQFYDSETVASGSYRTVMLGSCWGGWSCNNPSYHAPAHYRAMRNFMNYYGPSLGHGTEGATYVAYWNNLIATSYLILTGAQCSSNGLTPNWYVPNSNNPSAVGTTGCSGSGTSAGQFGSEAGRGIWRIILDWLWFSGESSTSSSNYLTPVVAEVIKQYPSWASLDTGCLITSIFSDYIQNSFIYGPLFTSLMFPTSASNQQTVLNAAATVVAGGSISSYYPGAWTTITTLTLNGDIVKSLDIVNLGGSSSSTTGNTATIPSPTPTTPTPTTPTPTPTPTTPTTPTPTTPTPTTTPTPSSTCQSTSSTLEAIYTGSFQNSFTGSWSWGTYSLSDTTYELNSQPSISLLLQNYNGLQLRCGSGNCINTAVYDRFTFYLNGGSTGGQVVTIGVRDSDTQVGSTSTVTATAKSWVQVVVYFSALTSETTLNVITFQDSTVGSGTGSTAYFSDIYLVPCQTTLTTSSNTITLMSNSDSANSTQSYVLIIVGVVLGVVILISIGVVFYLIKKRSAVPDLF